CAKIGPRERTRGEGMSWFAADRLRLRPPGLDHCIRHLLGALPSPPGPRLRAPGWGREQTERASRANPNRAKWGLHGAFLISVIIQIFFSLASDVASAETLRVGKAGREAFSFVPADVGQRTGIFKRHGVEIEISNFGGDARLQQAMAADGIDIALGSGPGLAFLVKGSRAKGSAAMAGPPLLFALVVRNDDTIKSADDLKGHKVGVSTVGSVTSWIITEVSRQKGWGVDGMTQVPIGDDANRIAALKTK